MNNHSPYDAFVSQLVRGEIPTAQPEERDALLHWLVGRDTPAGHAIQQAFDSHGTAVVDAQRLTLLYLDAVLFCHDADPYRLFGLLPGCDFADIRARHKRLLQVFHPDRHRDHQAWFTKRSERINHAYAYLKEHHGRPERRTAQRTVPANRPSAPRPSRGTSPWSARQWRALWASRGKLRQQLKTHLGNAARLERRLYIVLAAVPVLVLMIVYLNQPDITEPYGDAQLAKAKTGADDAERIPVRHAPHPPDALIAIVPVAANTGTADADGPLPKTPDIAALNATLVAVQTFDDAAIWENVITDLANTAADTTRIDQALAADPGDTSSVATMASTESPPSAATPNGDQPTRKSSAAISSLGPNSGNSPPPETAERQPAEQVASSEHEMRAAAAGQEVPPPKNAAEDKQLQPSEPTPDVVADSKPKTVSAPDTSAVASRDHGAKSAPQQPSRRSSASRPKQTANAAAKSEKPRTDQRLMAVKALLDRYQAAYSASDIDRFGALFQRDAQTKYAGGRQEIKKKYGEFFRSTSQRSVKFKDVRIRLLGDRQFQVLADYTAAWTFPGGRTDSTSGQFNIHLTSVGDELKIWRLNY